MTTIADVLATQGIDVEGENGAVLHEALLAREEELVGVLAINAVQFGVHPEIMAEVFAAIGIGRPKSDEEKALIHATYVAHMERLREEWLRQQGGQ